MSLVKAPSKKRRKGSFIEEPLDEYLVIDLETTGFSSESDEIIEFAGLIIREGNIVDEYITLIKPKNPISSFIEHLTGITNEMLDEQPSIEDVIGKIRKFINGYNLLGHNIHFDLNFLYDVLYKIDSFVLNNNYIDLLRVSRKLFPDLKSHRLIKLSNYLRMDISPSHRAETDAIVTYKIYELCKKKCIENNIDYKNLFKVKSKSKSLKPSDFNIKCNTNEEAIFDGDKFVFTGKLDKMNRETAWKLVNENGGIISNNVTKETNYLVLGNLSYSKLVKGSKSTKLRKAEELVIKGYDIKIISENVFYDMLEYN